jgi:hypothetical protein
MAIVVYLLQMLDSLQQPASGFSSMMVYSEKKTDTAGAIAQGVLVNGLIMVRTMPEHRLRKCKTGTAGAIAQGVLVNALIKVRAMPENRHRKKTPLAPSYRGCS